VPGRDRRTGLGPILAGAATGYGAATALLPIVAMPPSPAPRDVVTVVAAVLLSVGTAIVYARVVASITWIAWGAVLVSVAALLYSVTPAGLATAILAVFVGAGSGLSTGGPPWPGPRWSRSVGAFGAATVLVTSWWIGGLRSTLPFVVAAVGTAAVVLVRLGVGRGGSAVDREAARRDAVEPAPGRAPRRLLVAALVGAVGLTVWTGCNDPQLSWFGPVVSHGPRDGRQVAITFDDGPNATATLDLMKILDAHGVKGTFFLVGRAVAERPDVVRTVVADGHMVGNHSYRHDYQAWLNPFYPELGMTQEVIGREVGVCPRFFRPPHGQRTPLMNLQVARRGMVTVTWDVSAADWVTNDGELVAERILDRVRPGSIVLLHDSIDGHTDADRRVVVEALPRIIDGLRREGLEPVRLDELVGGPAYLPDSDC